MMGGGMGGMGWMWIFWLLLIVGTVVLVFVLVKAFTGGTGRNGSAVPPAGTGPRRAREILEERYARGEISTEEFRERLRTLEQDDR